MRIHSLQHVAFEDLGSMKGDLRLHKHSLSSTHWYLGDEPPALDSFDVLIVMGGPMGVYDEAQYPWLQDEKKFLLASITAGKKILGICLGAQLISCVLGAKVSQNAHREIGWHSITINPSAKSNPVAEILATCPLVFHWHGDRFELPEGATLIASSLACNHQAYVIDEKIYAFQFHLETTADSANALIRNCGTDLDNSAFVQTATEMLQNNEKFIAINRAMSAVLAEFLR